ncbi:MAG: choice-of-anchor J domain-containing protein [Muribaculaceae bacterium]|nr:choice-of-anchor J domain-containing protein [Muribaculaceae bacterium]
MKINLHIALSAFMTWAAFANSYATDYTLYEDWSQCHDGALPTGWTTTGTDKTPSGYAASFFEYGEGMKIMSLPGADGVYAVSYSSTLEGGKVDTRLVSPVFTVPEAGAILSFPAVNYNPDGSAANKIEVYVLDTESGNSEESVFVTRIAANNIVSHELCNISLGDYAGKDISLIIANEGTNAGLLGIGTVTVSEYIGEIYDKTPMFTTVEKKRKMALSVNLLAPCKGFTATLTTSTGINETYASDKDLSQVLTSYPLPFKSTFSLSQGEIMQYTVTVTPNMDGATPLVLSGSTGCGEGFPSVCVEEEGTGEKCGYCPSGAAGLEKFSDLYGDRFIGIGIHCTDIFSTGVMEAPTYAEPFVNNPAFPIESLPTAILNRSTSQSPTLFNDLQTAVENILAESSVAETKISTVIYDDTSNEINVHFDTRLALPLTDTDLHAAVVLLADNLTGNDLKWWQYNYYSGTTKEKFLREADESWWPYMQFYCEYPAQRISPTDLAFNHVAMGIWPDFNGEGCQLRKDWTDGESDSSEISFIMPMQQEANGFGVQNPTDTSVAVLIIDSRTGTIIAADKLNASSYETSSVPTLNANSRTPLRTYYISIEGLQTATPSSGLSLRVTEYTDGSRSAEKILTR